jgi:transcription elongation factor Elf1
VDNPARATHTAVMPKRPKPDWFTCPVCGAKVTEGAAACPECGADDETGWSADADYDDVDYLPAVDDEVTYETAERIEPRKSVWVVVVVAALLAVIVLGWVLSR